MILINKNLKQNLQDFFPEKNNIRSQADQQMQKLTRGKEEESFSLFQMWEVVTAEVSNSINNLNTIYKKRAD